MRPVAFAEPKPITAMNKDEQAFGRILWQEQIKALAHAWTMRNVKLGRIAGLHIRAKCRSLRFPSFYKTLCPGNK